MKKVFGLFIICLVGLFCGCSKDDKVIKVGASPAPHAEILEQVRSYIEEKGYTLEIVEYTDYIQPNLALADGSLDANYFQHTPYLEKFCAEHDLDLSSVLKVHFEPLGIYKGSKGTTLSELKKGDKIALPDDATNCARALQLLASNNVITIINDKGLETTIKDVDSKGLELVALEASLIAVQLPELAFAVINGNYAVDFDIEDKVVSQEDSSSIAYSLYANIIVVKSSDKETEKTKVLVDALSQKFVQEYISKSYGGLVVPYIETK